MQSVKDRIKELHDKIMLHRQGYNNKDLKGTDPDYIPITDAEFDDLYDELELLDPSDSAITEIGAEVSSEWPKVKHTVIAGSLTKVKSPDQIAKWIDAHFGKTDSIFCSQKIDGLTVLLSYDNGKLFLGATRGGGTEGEDITSNVRKMKGVKTLLNEKFSGVIRGEILMRKSIFVKHFADAGYVNARNAASGISRRYDGTGCEHLDVMCYEVVSGKKLDSEVFQFQYLEKLGLQTPGYEASASEDRAGWITSIWSEYQDGKRDKLDYDIDGLVVRVNDISTQRKLGIKHNRPVGATAFKFTSAEANSVVERIICQTGSTGVITPVLEITPVKIAGAEISRCSIYNFDYIDRLKIDVGATVKLIRSGDVIPVCIGVVKSTGTVFRKPSECLSCGGRVGPKGARLACLNSNACPAQVEGRLSNWITKLDVKEFGDKLIARLVESKLCLTIPDLYRMTTMELSEIDRMGIKSARKCIENLDAQLQDMTLDKFLGSLSIPLVGRTTIRLLMTAGYDTLDKILKITEKDLAAIKGFGDEKIKALLEGLKSNKKMIDELIGLGVIPMGKKNDVVKVSGILDGKNICITGKTIIKREELAKMIEARGGAFVKKVDASTTHLCMVKSDSGTIKAKTARAMGVSIIDETELMEMMEQ